MTNALASVTRVDGGVAVQDSAGNVVALRDEEVQPLIAALQTLMGSPMRRAAESHLAEHARLVGSARRG